MDNIRFVFYTSEINVPFAELCLKNFLKRTNDIDIKVSLISNNFINNDFQFKDKVLYLSGGVEFQKNGTHYAKTLINTLSQVDEEYVFMFIDDFFIFKDIKHNDLSDLINHIKCEGIDYFSFDNIDIRSDNFSKYESTCDNKYNEHFYKINNSHHNLFSVQPCIWKRESLLNLLKKYDYISGNQLDYTIDEIRQNNTYKTLSCNLKSWFNDYRDDENCDYFIIAYYEIVRHGVFSLPENGLPVNPNDNQVLFVKKLIDEEDLLNKPEFKNKIHTYAG
jgi:hypothetical protein